MGEQHGTPDGAPEDGERAGAPSRTEFDLFRNAVATLTAYLAVTRGDVAAADAVAFLRTAGDVEDLADASALVLPLCAIALRFAVDVAAASDRSVDEVLQTLGAGAASLGADDNGR